MDAYVNRRSSGKCMILSDLRASAWRIGTIVFGVLAVALLVACLFLKDLATRAAVRADAASRRAEASEAELKAVSKARDQEREAAKRANAIAARYEQEKIDAEAAAKRTADDLRAGTLRLRERWHGCEARSMSAPAGSSGEPDASADDRAESAGRIVRAADEADAQIRGLQDFIRSERQEGIVK